MNKRPTILVTRPHQQAEKTADVLRQNGFSTFVLPLTKTIPLTPGADPTGFNALIATSTAAFFLAPEERKKKWRQYPLYCVGTTTAEFARKDGFSVVATAPTAQKLIDCLKDENKHFLYLAGRWRRPNIEAAITAQNLDILEIYDTVKCNVDQEVIKNLPARFDALLLYSALAAENIAPLYALFDAQTIAYCLSERIAHSLSADFKGKCIIVKEPDEKSIIAALVCNSITVSR